MKKISFLLFFVFISLNLHASCLSPESHTIELINTDDEIQVEATFFGFPENIKTPLIQGGESTTVNIKTFPNHILVQFNVNFTGDIGHIYYFDFSTDNPGCSIHPWRTYSGTGYRAITIEQTDNKITITLGNWNTQNDPALCNNEVVSAASKDSSFIVDCFKILFMD